MARTSCSVLFLFISLLQISALVLSCLSHFPKLVTFGWKNFVCAGGRIFCDVDAEIAGMSADDKVKYMYGLWEKCEEDDLGSCKYIEDGDRMLVDDDYYSQLQWARYALVAANLLAILTVVTSVWNTFKQSRVSTGLHLLLAFFQLSCCATSAALVTRILQAASEDLELGWVLICFWVSVGLMVLVMLFSILSTCCEVTYGEYEDNYGGKQREDKYRLEQVQQVHYNTAYDQ